jgi:kumamolisin
MALPHGYKSVDGTQHNRPIHHQVLRATDAGEQVTVTVMLRRRQDSKPRELKDFVAEARVHHVHQDRSVVESAHGADPREIAAVEAFAARHKLAVVETSQSRRSVIVRGSASAINQAFALELQDVESPAGKYRSHSGPVNVPDGIADYVEAVVGLTNRQVPAQHFSTARRQNSQDPSQTEPLTPAQVAALYNFPSGTGAGQTIGIYEMVTNEGPPGYAKSDIAKTMKGFGGNLTVPEPIDIAIDGTGNSGVSDGETDLDITVASAIAQEAKIAVYFTGGTTQNIIHALQRMIHPGSGDPVPTIISISYGWGPDDTTEVFSDSEFEQVSQLFQDAANLSVSVLVSSGDSGAFVSDKTHAQVSYPAADPWVTACGGTTIGNIKGSTFSEYVWNDTGAAGPGATGGGVSTRFPVPDYQASAGLNPVSLTTEEHGRGVPDLAGNASENSGYPEVIGGQPAQPVGGTSAVAPLYAGLFAVMNSNLGRAVGFVNPILYAGARGAFHGVGGPPGPADNSYGAVKGYPATGWWNACTGLGRADGKALQDALQAALKITMPGPVPPAKQKDAA